ncbi:hypothetical protein [Leptospira interrogans]|uniref:hypothetical protein n=1 Tax=Leptospira interrogans TaxID=173 RepID=UPI0007730169|nr:hypothetical protein [Leptospira interrogans]
MKEKQTKLKRRIHEVAKTEGFEEFAFYLRIKTFGQRFEKMTSLEKREGSETTSFELSPLPRENTKSLAEVPESCRPGYGDEKEVTSSWKQDEKNAKTLRILEVLFLSLQFPLFSSPLELPLNFLKNPESSFRMKKDIRLEDAERNFPL